MQNLNFTKIRNIFKTLVWGLSTLTLSIACYAASTDQAKPADVQYVPLAQYEQLTVASQYIRSLSAGLVINRDTSVFVGMMSQHTFEEALSNNVAEQLTTLDVMLDVAKGRHQYLGMVKGASDGLFSSRLENYQAAAVYGYEWIHNAHVSFVAGGGFALGNFGIETANGNNWPLIPVPLLRFNSQSKWLNTQFEFLTSPNLSFSLAPKGPIRLNGDFRMDQMRDARDIIFETTLEYRPFSEESAMGDFAGLSIGFKNDTYQAFMNNKNAVNDSAEVQYQAVFAAFDLSLLKVTTGYAMNARTRFSDTNNENLDEGFFLSVQGMYAF